MSDMQRETVTAVLVVVLYLGFLFGVGSFAMWVTAPVTTKPGPQPEQRPAAVKLYTQRCERCGTVWTVQPINPNSPVPPETIEWCYHDGGYCEVGLKIIVEAHRNGRTATDERAWLNHCLTCESCRMASFTPEGWRKITEAVRAVRE